MNLKEKQLVKNYIYKGKIINMRSDTALLPDGSTAVREIVEHPGGVCVAALDDDNNILLVRQFRYPYFEEILEIPAGKRNSPDEDPLECGRRELLEETGAMAESISFLGQLYPTPGYCEEIIWMYFATGLTFGDARPDDDEFLEPVRLPFDKALEMVMSGEIKDAKTQTAILKIKMLMDKGHIGIN